MGPCASKKKKEDFRPIEKGQTIYERPGGGSRINRNKKRVDSKKDFTY